MNFDIETAGLINKRSAVGAETAEGHHYSNIVEILDNMPPGPDERIEYLTPDWVIAKRANLMQFAGVPGGGAAAAPRAYQ